MGNGEKGKGKRSQSLSPHLHMYAPYLCEKLKWRKRGLPRKLLNTELLNDERAMETRTRQSSYWGRESSIDSESNYW